MNSWKVLVIDDQPQITANLKKHLTLEGYETRVGQNITEAEFLMKRYDFDIAILDIMLPDGNGIDLYCKLRDKNPEIYTIMITGNATIENTITALNEGVNAYLVKPFPREQLKAALIQAGKILKLRAQNAALFQSLQSNRQMYENLLNSTSEAILVVDLDFKIQFFNKAAQELLQQDENALRKQMLHPFIEDGYKVLSHIYQQLVLGKTVAGYRVGIKAGNSKSIDAHLSADFLHNQNGHIDGLIVNLSNTMIHDELFGRILRKEKLSTIINLANSLSHEIRNPINILYGRLQLLAEEMPGENFNHAYQSIQRQIDRLLNITNLLAKFNLNREDSIPEKFSVVEVLQTVLDAKDERFRDKQILLRSKFEKHEYTIEGNHAQFQDAFGYLLDALFEFTPIQKTIEVRGKVSNGYTTTPWVEIQFYIPDVQISAEQILDPYQSDELMSNSLVGLGMTIMLTIFNNYNGKIETHLVNGKDSLIRLRFPIYQEKRIQTQAKNEKNFVVKNES